MKQDEKRTEPAKSADVPHIDLHDKEREGDRVTVHGAPRTSKSFGEPKWAT